MRMCFAAIDKLDRSNLARYFSQPLRVLEQQIRALVSTGASCKADRENFRVKLNSKCASNLGEQFSFCFGVRFANRGQRNADRIPQIVVIGAPAWNIRIK